MSEPASSTRDQTPDDVQRLVPGVRAAFASGDTVPGLNSWVLDRKLGGGGFGEVWLARHALNNKEKPRAVKFCTDPAARHRLVTHERNVVSRVMKYAGDHPNIIPLLDYNLDGDIPWLMYEFVAGGTLASLIEKWRKIPLPERIDNAVRTLHAVAGALAACHRFDPPLVHRDMKPQNILMAGWVPRITDFGIGSVVLQPRTGDATGALTASAARLPSELHSAGTRLYAPAEQTLGSTPNPRDDVYALGIIAYQLITADLTTGPGADATLELRDLRIPDELAALIIRSAAIDPNRRPKDATEWAMTLGSIIGRAPTPSHPDGRWLIPSKPVIVLEPESTPTTGPSAHTRPSALPTAHRTSSTEPRPAARPPRREPPRFRPTRRRLLMKALNWALVLPSLLVIAVGLLMASCWVSVAVLELLSPDPVRRSEPTRPSAELAKPKSDAPKTMPELKDEPPQPKAPEPKSKDPETKGPEAKLKDPEPEPKPKAKESEPKPKVASIPKPGETREVEIARGVPMTFCWIPAGECQLGSPKAERALVLSLLGEAREPEWLQYEADSERKVFKTQGFWMGKYEVTQEEWQAVMNGANPSYFDGKKGGSVYGMNTSRFPVERVSWDMICGNDGRGGFLAKVNARDGIQYALGKAGEFALPHEDAWEYACRGGFGDARPFHFGNAFNGTEANSNGNEPYGTSTKGAYLERTCEVVFTNGGKYKPHPWGLMHMHGNVFEWCENLYPRTKQRVLRGGSWSSPARTCRAASRDYVAPHFFNQSIGFRLVVRLK